MELEDLDKHMTVEDIAYYLDMLSLQVPPFYDNVMEHIKKLFRHLLTVIDYEPTSEDNNLLRSDD